MELNSLKETGFMKEVVQMGRLGLIIMSDGANWWQSRDKKILYLPETKFLIILKGLCSY